MAPYITGAVKDATGSYQAPMFIVGGFHADVGVLARHVRRRGKAATAPMAGDMPSSRTPYAKYRFFTDTNSRRY